MWLGGGIDYDSISNAVTISAGQTNIPFSVPIHDDMILEGNEGFYLIINASSVPSRVIVVNPDQVEVIIVDNDGKINT